MSMIKSCLAAALAVMTLAGTAALASEDKYPAADFKPSVIYSNPELVAKSAVPAAAAPQPAQVDPKYPAAYFNPVILYPAH